MVFLGDGAGVEADLNTAVCMEAKGAGFISQPDRRSGYNLFEFIEAIPCPIFMEFF